MGEIGDPGRDAAALRGRIVLAAADLLEEGGVEALSTRAVAARAGVTPPAIFRLFGDKSGLLEAVGEHGFETYLQFKTQLPATDDPVQDLRVAWDLHIRFGLVRPAYYTLVYGQGRAGRPTRAGRRAVAELERVIMRVAAVGRLRVSVERATAIMHAAGVGTVLTMDDSPVGPGGPQNADATRDLVIAAITTPRTDPPGHTGGGVGTRDDDTASTAMALRAALGRGDVSALGAEEKSLLIVWLNRLADAGREPGGGG